MDFVSVRFFCDIDSDILQHWTQLPLQTTYAVDRLKKWRRVQDLEFEGSVGQENGTKKHTRKKKIIINKVPLQLFVA